MAEWSDVLVIGTSPSETVRQLAATVMVATGRITTAAHTSVIARHFFILILHCIFLYFSIDETSGRKHAVSSRQRGATTRQTSPVMMTNRLSVVIYEFGQYASTNSSSLLMTLRQFRVVHGLG